MSSILKSLKKSWHSRRMDHIYPVSLNTPLEQCLLSLAGGRSYSVKQGLQSLSSWWSSHCPLKYTNSPLEQWCGSSIFTLGGGHFSEEFALILENCTQASEGLETRKSLVIGRGKSWKYATLWDSGNLDWRPKSVVGLRKKQKKKKKRMEL